MAELATVRVHRPSLWALVGTGPVAVEVDGREVGRLRNGQSLVTYVETGRHQLRPRHWGIASESLELELLPGEDVRLETRYEPRNAGFTFQVSLVRTDTGAGPGAPVLRATETHRSEESMGTENLRIENASGAARLTRTVRVTREWSRTVGLEDHSGRSDSTSKGFGPTWLTLRTSVEQSLSRTYSVAENTREEFAEEFSVEVDPGAGVTVVLAWKRLWQHGVVQVLFQGRQVEVPFRWPSVSLSTNSFCNSSTSWTNQSSRSPVSPLVSLRSWPSSSVSCQVNAVVASSPPGPIGGFDE